MDRRQLITGLISLCAAPAIVRAGSLMPVKQMITPIIRTEWVVTAVLGDFVRIVDGRDVVGDMVGTYCIERVSGVVRVGDRVNVDLNTGQII